MSVSDPRSWRSAAAAAGDAHAPVAAALELAGPFVDALDGAGAGAAGALDLLAAVGSGDLTVARVLEPHLDALTILAEAGMVAAAGTWGVFAAEAPGSVLRAEPAGSGWTLSGVKPWCSLAGVLDRALVTATLEGGRRLFAVDLRHPGVVPRDVAWVARGLRDVVSTPVGFDAVPAEPVGGTGWYVERPGFGWGAIRVASCWLGGAAGVLDDLRTDLATRPDPGEIRLFSLGVCDAALWAAERVTTDAGRAIDAGEADGAAGSLLAARVRAVVAEAAETVLLASGHARGPAPLAFDERHARRVADLGLYLRQHHAERDLAALGRSVLHADG